MSLQPGEDSTSHSLQRVDAWLDKSLVEVHLNGLDITHLPLGTLLAVILFLVHSNAEEEVLEADSVEDRIVGHRLKCPKNVGNENR